MNLRELEYILVLSEEKNLTRAADRLFITPSALTQQVMRLENELNTPLFLRSRNGWQLTPEGEVYLEAAKKMLALKRDTYRQIQDMTRQRKYTLSIGVPPERGSDIFAAVYPRFRERYPEITIHLRETSVQAQQELIAAGHLDLGFLTLADSQKSQDEYRLLQKEEILIAVPWKYPDELLMPQPPDEGSEYPVVPLSRLRHEPFAMRDRSSTLRQVQEEIFLKNGIQPERSFEMARSKTIFEMIGYNLCCSLICSYCVPYLPPQKIKVYAMPEHPAWENVVSWRKGAYLSEAEKYFIRLVKMHYEGTLSTME